MSATARKELAALRDSLERATDDGERAGLHDAVAIHLSRHGRLEEALAENLQAVTLRDTLAERDPAVLPVLAVSLGNQGSHLALLGRYVDAVVSHLRALEILWQLDPDLPMALQGTATGCS
jgi:hypothetical protein